MATNDEANDIDRDELVIKNEDCSSTWVTTLKLPAMPNDSADVFLTSKISMKVSTKATNEDEKQRHHE